MVLLTCRSNLRSQCVVAVAVAAAVAVGPPPPLPPPPPPARFPSAASDEATAACAARRAALLRPRTAAATAFVHRCRLLNENRRSLRQSLKKTSGSGARFRCSYLLLTKKVPGRLPLGRCRRLGLGRQQLLPRGRVAPLLLLLPRGGGYSAGLGVGVGVLRHLRTDKQDAY